ncbi:ATP synthase F(0) complex subunit B1, mitochondrial [Exaiptasia diaphana]|uniref:ATP synthase subunit b n=1 Tax=Exaiptasia diaphana TaxID=2652724 RepID=A0A913XGQ0_EXADI|nr:ATP synthase F(0) complex subunit B1, mitochondrial [Exaiptasia diaphana]KXJ26032.1 ATP synthase F(0) complex subunit B1, mitochondrial [Exaiptasia diaphana]
MLSRVHLARRLVSGTSRFLQASKTSFPAVTRFCQTEVEKKEPEFGQFFRDVSAKLKQKTGETGHLMLFGGLGAYALSKELFVIHEETYLAAVMAGTFIWVIKKSGSSVAELLDNYSKEILDNFNLSRNQQIDALNNAIANEMKLDDMLLCRIDIAEILKENNVMGMELEYRNRLHNVKNEVKKRLDYQLELENFKRKTEQDHIIDWVEKEVIKSITPQQEKESINQCIKDLKAMAV